MSAEIGKRSSPVNFHSDYFVQVYVTVLCQFDREVVHFLETPLTYWCVHSGTTLPVNHPKVTAVSISYYGF